MKSHKIILTDVDGVLLEMRPGLMRFLQQEKNIPIKETDWDKGYYLSDVIDITPEYAKALFIEFTHSQYFKTLCAKPCALQVMQEMAGEGWRFIAITAAGQNCSTQDLNKVRQNRLDNLEMHFGSVFDDIHLTHLFDCKGGILEQYNPSYWIEDSVKNAHIGSDKGHHALIMHSMYYKQEDNHRGLPVLDNWHEIYSYIQKYEKE